MIGIQAYSTENREKIDLDHVSILTWLASIVNWRKTGLPLILHTDARGKRYMDKIGISTLYDEVRLTLEGDPYHPDLWAMAKIKALKAHANEPFCLFDYDLIPWDYDPRTATAPVTWLHDEPPGWYSRCYKNFNRYFPKQAFTPEQWALPAANTALVVQRDPGMLDDYIATVDAFAKAYAAKPKQRKLAKGLSMVFMEQLLLPMCLARQGVEGKPWCKLRVIGGQWQHIEWNQQITHVWNSKQIYRMCWHANYRYCMYMISFLESRNVLPAAVGELKRQMVHAQAKEGDRLRAHDERLAKRSKEGFMWLQANGKLKEPNIPELLPLQADELVMPWDEFVLTSGTAILGRTLSPSIKTGVLQPQNQG